MTEQAGRQREKAIKWLEQVTDMHSQHFIYISRHLEDLDNRGRWNNLRLRGVPELVMLEQVPQALQKIFNNLLERPTDVTIEFIHAHRTLRARGPDTAPLHDIICCFQNFVLKEEVLSKAWQNEAILFNNNTILLFKNLSPITL